MQAFYFFNPIVMMAFALFGCRGPAQSKTTYCEESYNRANEYFNKYYKENNRQVLDTALSIIDRDLSFCNSYKIQMGDMKIKVFLLTKNFERGQKFIDSLSEDDFDKKYQKALYLATFSEMRAESDHVVLNKRDIYTSTIEKIQSYLLSHPSDRIAVADYFSLKAKVNDREKVVEEISVFRKKQTISDSLFWDGLINSVRELPDDY